jgi:hypothetical protein
MSSGFSIEKSRCLRLLKNHLKIEMQTTLSRGSSLIRHSTQHDNMQSNRLMP